VPQPGAGASDWLQTVWVSVRSVRAGYVVKRGESSIQAALSFPSVFGCVGIGHASGPQSVAAAFVVPGRAIGP
jgi:hypothetical protein